MKIHPQDKHLLQTYSEDIILLGNRLVYTSADDCRVNLIYETSSEVLKCALAMIEGKEGQATKRTHIERALKRLEKSNREGVSRLP